VVGRKRPSYFCAPLKVADALQSDGDSGPSMASPLLPRLAALLGRMAAREVWAGSTGQRCSELRGIEGSEVP
jgi:hypothetical protein